MAYLADSMVSVLDFRTRSQFLYSTPDKCSFELIFATRPDRGVGKVELGIFPTGGIMPKSKVGMAGIQTGS